MIDVWCRAWLDTSKGKNKRTLSECIEAAQASHRRGTGQDATVCYINTNAHPDAPPVVADVHIRRDKGVPPNYYWMTVNGVEPAEEEAEPVEALVDEPVTEGSYKCQECGEVWLVPAAWCAKCGWDGKEFVYGR